MNLQRGFTWPLLLGALVIVLIVSGGAYWYVHQKPNSIQSSDSQIYTNSKYGFSLHYPTGSVVNESSKSVSQGTQVVSIGVGQRYVSDFVEVDVGQSTSDCVAPDRSSNNPPSASGTAVISGVTFNKYTINDPAAGLLGLGYIYRAAHNNLCFTIRAAYGGAEPSHYQGAEAAQIEAKNEAGVAQVDAIARSFTFTN